MTQATVTEIMTDQLILVEGLYNIAIESEDAETIRSACSVLMNTEAGRMYLKTHPMVL